MYICICNGITEEQLKSAAKTSHSHKDVLKKLGVGDSCGICLIDALEKIAPESELKSSDSVTIAPVSSK